MNQAQYNSTLKNTINRYCTATLWCTIYYNDPSVKPATYAHQLKKLEAAEGELARLGISDKGIKKLIDYVGKIATRPTDKELEKLAILIFR